MIPEKLKKGERYKNQTDKWLRPVLAYILPDYIKKYFRLADYNIQVLGYFRGDALYSDATLDETKSLIFVVFDVNGRYYEKTNKYKDSVKGSEDFFKFLSELRQSKFAYCDYSCKFDNRKIHICVFNLQGWEKAFEAFDAGKYSSMFSLTEISKLKFDNNQEITWIVKKDEKARELFKQKLEDRFNTGVMPVEPAEYEITPLKKDEILNC